MNANTDVQTTVTPEAFKVYNNIGGSIKDLALKLVIQRLRDERRSVADVNDIKWGYSEACKRVLAPTPQ